MMSDLEFSVRTGLGLAALMSPFVYLADYNEWSEDEEHVGNPWTNFTALERDFKAVVERWLRGSGGDLVDVEWAELPYKAPNPSPAPRPAFDHYLANYSTPAGEHGPAYDQHMRDAGRGGMVR